MDTILFLSLKMVEKPTGAAVMVYIHGGGFSLGTAMVYDWYGVPLVAVGEVIIVTINYRLAVFAKFTTSKTFNEMEKYVFVD